MDLKEEEMYLASPGGANATYQGFERSIDANISPSDDRAAGYSSSEAEGLPQSQSLPRSKDRTNAHPIPRNSSQVDYSGAEHGSYSDFSDSGFAATARMSALSLASPDVRPSTSSAPTQQVISVYGPASTRPSMGARNPSQLSTLASPSDDKKPPNIPDEERIVYHGWIQLLKSKSGVRQWKKVWMVLRPKQLALYKDNEEYTAQLVLPFSSILDAVEIDAISKTKLSCMQIISEERNYRFCAADEESLAKWLGAFKSLLSKRKVMATT